MSTKRLRRIWAQIKADILAGNRAPRVSHFYQGLPFYLDSFVTDLQSWVGTLIANKGNQYDSFVDALGDGSFKALRPRLEAVYKEI